MDYAWYTPYLVQEQNFPLFLFVHFAASTLEGCCLLYLSCVTSDWRVGNKFDTNFFVALTEDGGGKMLDKLVLFCPQTADYSLQEMELQSC